MNYKGGGFMMAETKYPNTPESDRQARVCHVVTRGDGTTVEVYATDPMEAIALVQRRDAHDPTRGGAE